MYTYIKGWGLLNCSKDHEMQGSAACLSSSNAESSYIPDMKDVTCLQLLWLLPVLFFFDMLIWHWKKQWLSLFLGCCQFLMYLSSAQFYKPFCLNIEKLYFFCIIHFLDYAFLMWRWSLRGKIFCTGNNVGRITISSRTAWIIIYNCIVVLLWVCTKCFVGVVFIL